MFALGLEERVCGGVLVFLAPCCLTDPSTDLVAVIERVAGLEGGEITIGVTTGEVAVGVEGFLLALFAFLLRSFSSSSEEVASESFALKSMLH